MALFNSRAKAELIQHRLVRAGIEAQTAEKPRLARLWMVSQAGVWVEVPAEQFERAEQLLLDWDGAEGALRDAIRCPECWSLRVLYPQFARHSVLTNLGLGMLSQFGLVERDYYCEDCHFAWPKEGPKARRRPHMAPYYFIEGIEQTMRAQPPTSAAGEREAA